VFVASLTLVLVSLIPTDSTRRVADTLFIEPLGVRALVPPLWMGRVPEGATMRAPGRGRFGCQLDVSKPISDRVVIDPADFPAMLQGIYGPVRSAQEALDSVLPRSAMVASVGGDRVNGSCVAPHIHFYVADAVLPISPMIASIAHRVVERTFQGVERVEGDSASWHVISLSWTDTQTDFIKPGTLEILTRRFGDRVLLVAVMDGWSGRGDANEFLASIR
jgi:hypothetical protein